MLSLLVVFLSSIFAPSAGAQDGSDHPGPVVISEFLASNASVSADAFENFSDWIELHNPTPNPISLTGWQLRDANNTWTFPASSIAANSYLVVRASSNNTTATNGELHTNFSLSADGEFLGLFMPDGTRASAYGIEYPQQWTDISYGTDTTGTPGYFTTPTPGSPNTTTAGLAPAQPPQAAIGRGLYDATVVEALSTTTPNATIHYTLDGTTPTNTSPTYTSPITIAPTPGIGVVTLRARTYAPGRAPSEETGWSYVFPDMAIPELAGSGAEISAFPIIIVSQTNGTETPEGTFQTLPGRIEYIDPNGPGFASLAGVATTGAATVQTVQSVRVHFDNEYGASNLDYPLFDDVAHGFYDPATTFDKLDLRNFSHDASLSSFSPITGNYLISDRFWKDTALELGSLAPHGKFVMVFNGGTFKGLMHLREVFGAAFIAEYEPGRSQDYSTIYYRVYHTTPDNYTEPDGSYSDWRPVRTLRTDYSAFAERADVWSWVVDGLFETWVGGSRESEWRVSGPSLASGLSTKWISMHNDNDWELGRIDTTRNVFSGHWSDDFARLWINDPAFVADHGSRISWAVCPGGPMSLDGMLDRLDRLAAQIAPGLMTTGFARFGAASWERVRDSHLDHIEQARTKITAAAPVKFDALTAAGLVTSCDQAPGIDFYDETHHVVGQTVNLSIADTNNPTTVTYTATGLPTGLNLDPTTGLITGTPQQTGTTTTTITATDTTTGTTTTHPITWTIHPGTLDTPLVLNEYNAVANDQTLFAGTDPAFTNPIGNGGDWLELVVTQTTNLAGYTIETFDRDRTNNTLATTNTFTFTNHPLLNNLAPGTIITITENQPDDLTYDPANGDWTIQAGINNLAQSALFEPLTQTNFDTNRHNFHILIRDPNNTPTSALMGETDDWRTTTNNVGNDETQTLCTTPTNTPHPLTDRQDTGTHSTYGTPNTCTTTTNNTTTTTTQTLAPLRTAPTPNCNNQTDTNDPQHILDYLVGTRTNTNTCPTTTTTINLAASDTNDNGTITIADAQILAQCLNAPTHPTCRN